MSGLGQKRRFGDVRATSALPPKTDIHRERRHVSNVPETEVGPAIPMRGFGAAVALALTRLVSPRAMALYLGNDKALGPVKTLFAACASMELLTKSLYECSQIVSVVLKNSPNLFETRELGPFF
jgi:hypothetical protein